MVGATVSGGWDLVGSGEDIFLKFLFNLLVLEFIKLIIISFLKIFTFLFIF